MTATGQLGIVGASGKTMKVDSQGTKADMRDLETVRVSATRPCGLGAGGRMETFRRTQLWLADRVVAAHH